jgi:hypothetical protein
VIDIYYTLAAGRVVPRWMDERYLYLLPASSWSRINFRAPRLPHGARYAADSGAFMASRKWGDYRYTPAQYVQWLTTFTPEWASTMDYLCEPDSRLNRFHQHRTTHNAYQFWDKYRDSPWAWVPTIQGWEPHEYAEHARELKELIMEMQATYERAGNPHFRVGVGTLVRAKAPQIVEILHAIREELPTVKFHLWGVKLRVLSSKLALPHTRSVDTGAWAFATKASRHRKNEAQHALGMTQREYDFKIALPQYDAKIEQALHMTRQEWLL